MATLTINGQQHTGNDARKLLDYLRDELRITSVKNGCGEGACGACTVLVDGKATRACVFTLGRLEGKSVLTTEGLTPREKDVYAYAFAEAGAVQCGFCIPGMVLSAKALLDVDPDPGPDAIKKALRGNICRCTGYVKIEDAVRIAARLLREGTPVPSHSFTGALGEDFHRVDAAAKTLGTGEYVDDVVVKGMLYGSALRPPAPRVRVLKIDPSEALAHPDCEAVLTAKDVPGNIKIGHLAFISDYDVFIAEGGVTRFVGDALALVVSRRKESLAEIKALVRLEYEELPPLTSPAAALAEGAPLLHDKPGNILAHEHLAKGDADAALAASAHVVTQHYSVPFTEHAFMEPECAIAMPEGENGVFMYTGGQGIYDEQRECARMLGVEPELVHVQSKLVGGGFGGKEDMSVQHHACLAAYVLKKPVKVLLTRAESMLVHPKRHAMEMDFTTGCDAEGRLTALKATIVSDTGAYASLGGPVLQRACTHASGPYRFDHYDIDGKAVYTNNPPGGAFRGFGVSQSQFAMENNLNLLAEKAGISPWAIRYLNAVRPGQRLPNGQIVDGSTGIESCLLAVKDAYDKAGIAGIACAFKNSGLGVGIPDTGRCIVSVEADGKVHIRSSAACIGQGMATVTTQIVCETLGLPPALTLAEPPDTRRTPDAGTTTASRQTTLTGEAARLAAEKLKTELDALISKGNTLEEALKALTGQEFLGEYTGVTDPLNNDKADPVYHVAYGFAAEVIELWPDGRVKQVTAAYDMGKVVNPKAAAGQIEGGIAMGLGYAFTEDYPLENSVPKAKYGTLGLWRATDMPPVSVVCVQGPGLAPLAYGAKGCGEIATIPTAPAASGAYYALDGVLRAALPMQNTYYRKAKA